MSNLFRRPMKAAALLNADEIHSNENILSALEKLWEKNASPRYATLKRDGIRGFRANGSLLSCSLKKIPNKSIVARSLKLPAGFDVELFNPSLPYNDIQSIVLSAEHEDSDLIQFHCLDWYQFDRPMMSYLERIDKMYYTSIDFDGCYDVVSPRLEECKTPQQLLDCFLRAEEDNNEGICFRLGNSPYKPYARATLKEQYLIKLCRYTREEVTIIGVVEQLENANPEKRNGIGLMDRRSHKDNLIGKNTLGALSCLRENGEPIMVGTGVGLTDKLRKEIWVNRGKYIGQVITIKYKGHGMKNKLRSPIMVGFREKGY